jgi:hypothetical protein
VRGARGKRGDWREALVAPGQALFSAATHDAGAAAARAACRTPVALLLLAVLASRLAHPRDSRYTVSSVSWSTAAWGRGGGRTG